VGNQTEEKSQFLQNSMEVERTAVLANCCLTIMLAGGVAQRLECQHLAAGLSLIYA